LDLLPDLPRQFKRQSGLVVALKRVKKLLLVRFTNRAVRRTCTLQQRRPLAGNKFQHIRVWFVANLEHGTNHSVVAELLKLLYSLRKHIALALRHKGLAV